MPPTGPYDGQDRSIAAIRRMLLLRSTPGLPDVDTGTLRMIADLMCVREFAAGEALLRAGKPAAAMYYVVEGRVRIERHGRFFRHVGPRQPPVGVMAVYGRDPQGIDAIAEQDTVALELRADDVFDLLEQRSSVRLAVVRSVARELLERRRELGYTNALDFTPQPPVALPPGGLDLVQRVDLLRHIFVMSSFRLTAAFELARHTPIASLPAGSWLWRRGEEADHFYMLLDGQVDCTTQANTMFTFGPRDAVGLVSLLAGQAHDYDAQVRVRAVALRIPGFAFLDLVREHHEFGIEALAITANGVFNMYEKLAAAGRGQWAAANDSVNEWLRALS